MSQLSYKSQWYCREFVKEWIHSCGVVASENRKGKMYKCGNCGLGMDADTNAAINILRRGLPATGVGMSPGLVA